MLPLKRRPRRINNERTEADEGQHGSDPPLILTHRLPKTPSCDRNQIRCHRNDSTIEICNPKLFVETAKVLRQIAL